MYVDSTFQEEVTRFLEEKASETTHFMRLARSLPAHPFSDWKKAVFSNWQVEEDALHHFAGKAVAITMILEGDGTPVAVQNLVNHLHHHPATKTDDSAWRLSDELSRLVVCGELVGCLVGSGLLIIMNRRGRKSRLRSLYTTDRYPVEDRHAPAFQILPLAGKNRRVDGSSILLGHAMHHHEEAVRIRHIERMDKIPFSLGKAFVESTVETPKEAPETLEEQKEWESHLKVACRLRDRVIQAGNRFHFHHAYCTRGRTYPKSFALSYQGSKYQQAMVELAETEQVTE